jgi:hypothetical protein
LQTSPGIRHSSGAARRGAWRRRGLLVLARGLR